MLKAAALATVALSLFLTHPAAAESKSWAAVKGSVTPKAAFIIGANLDPIRKTTTFATAMTMFLDGNQDAKEAFDLVKAQCAIDVPSAISDVTAIMKADEKPLVVLGLNGLDQTKIVACMEKIVASFAGGAAVPKLTLKKSGKITEYSMAGERKKIYLAWLAPDVLAFTDDPLNKGKLTKMLAGKAAKGTIGAMVGKVSTSAAIWAAVVKKEPADGIGTILGGYGAVEITSSTGAGSFATVTATAHLMMAKPAEAATAVTAGMAALAEAKQQAAKVPVAVKVIDTVKLTVTGSEVNVSASIADKDIMTMVEQFDKIF